MTNTQVQEVIIKSIKEAIEAGATINNLWSSDTEARKALSGRVKHNLSQAKIALPKVDELDPMIDFEVNQERLQLEDSDDDYGSRASNSEQVLKIRAHVIASLPTWKLRKKIILESKSLGLPFLTTTAMYRVMDDLKIDRNTYTRRGSRGEHTKGGRVNKIRLTLVDA